MHYALGQEPCPLLFLPSKSCTVLRPIGSLSTASKDDIAYLTPCNQWQNLTFDPPLVMFAANQLSIGQRKATVINAKETSWFVWDMVICALREAVNISERRRFQVGW
jgi:flavin reductase (DIM6/NTAB) family NADH-FMN oxidoreductase RutF